MVYSVKTILNLIIESICQTTKQYLSRFIWNYSSKIILNSNYLCFILMDNRFESISWLLQIKFTFMLKGLIIDE